MNNTTIRKSFLFPDDIFKKILSINTKTIKQEKEELVKKILSYYKTHDIIPDDLKKQEELSILVIKALKYQECLNLLYQDEYFYKSYQKHQNGNKFYRNMDWIYSLITSIWMHKFH